MTIDARPTATIPFKKNFDEPIDLRAKHYVLNELDFVIMSMTFIKNDS